MDSNMWFPLIVASVVFIWWAYCDFKQYCRNLDAENQRMRDDFEWQGIQNFNNRTRHNVNWKRDGF